MEKYTKFIDHIVEFTVEEVGHFIAEHPSEVFYAFAYDCNLETKGIYLSFNTKASFEKTLKSYQSSEYGEYYHEKKQITRLKFNPGDWKYHNFVSIEFVYEDKLRELFGIDLDPKTKQLLKAAERALLEFRKTEVYKKIPKTENFISFCIDHDEDELIALNRSLCIN